MANGDAVKCVEHTGCVARIGNLEHDGEVQWSAIRKHDDRIDSIIAKLNVSLGGIAVSCILLIANLIYK